MVAAYLRGRNAALEKLGLASTQVDPGLAATERGMDVPPDAAVPPMSRVPGDVPMSWAGSAPLRLQLPTASSQGSSSPATPSGGGSTVGALAGDPAPETHPKFHSLTG